MSFETGMVYIGEVIEATLDFAYQSEQDLVAKFQIKCEEGVITAKHKLYGDDKTMDRTKEVLRQFGVKSMAEVGQLPELAPGQSCGVWIGEVNGRQYGKINTRRAPDVEKINAAVQRLVDDEEVPF